MPKFQKVEFEFPDPDSIDDDPIEIDGSSAEELGKPPAQKTKAEDDVIVEGDDDDDDDDDDDLEVIDDVPEIDRGRKPSEPPTEISDEELRGYSKEVRSKIKHFTKVYHDERRAKEQQLRERQELERVTAKLIEENKKLREETSTSQSAAIAQSKQNVAAALEVAKRKYRDAYEAGDTEALLEANEELTSLRIKADRLDNFKPTPLQEPETRVKQEPQNPPARQAQRDARAEKWAKENTWFNKDIEMTSYALGLHNKLVQDGYDTQSDEYYEKIDSRMRQLFSERFEDDAGTTPDKKAKKKPQSAVAPASRNTAPKKIRLTQTQVTLARRLGLTPQQYAKQVALDMRNNNG